MLQIRFESNHSAFIEFDESGRHILKEYIDSILTHENVNLDHYEKFNFTLGINNEINLIEKKLNKNYDIKLDVDELEFLSERLDECNIKNGFYPAEVADLDYGKKTITLYAKYVF